MKKRVAKILFISVTAILIGFIFLINMFKPGDIGNTPQEATLKTGRKIVETIYEEKVQGGEILFYIKNSPDYNKAIIAAGYVKKTIWGWEWVSGGEHGSINSMTKSNGFSAQFFPATKGTPFPMYFGAITNPQIDKISVIENNRNIKMDAEISGSGDVRVWHMSMGKMKGSKFAIKAYSKEGTELSSVNDNTSPYTADQKPMKLQNAS